VNIAVNQRGGTDLSLKRGAEFRIVDLDTKPATRFSGDVVLSDHFDRHFSTSITHSVLEPAHAHFEPIIPEQNDYLS